MLLLRLGCRFCSLLLFEYKYEPSTHHQSFFIHYCTYTLSLLSLIHAHHNHNPQIRHLCLPPSAATSSETKQTPQPPSNLTPSHTLHPFRDSYNIYIHKQAMAASPAHSTSSGHNSDNNDDESIYYGVFKCRNELFWEWTYYGYVERRIERLDDEMQGKQYYTMCARNLTSFPLSLIITHTTSYNIIHNAQHYFPQRSWVCTTLKWCPCCVSWLCRAGKSTWRRRKASWSRRFRMLWQASRRAQRSCGNCSKVS